MSHQFRSGIRLAALNAVLILSFFGTMFAAIFGNRFLFEKGGVMIPVVPIVVLLFVMIAFGAWFSAGHRLTLSMKPRIQSALIGSLPIALGILLSIGLLTFNIVFGNAQAAAAVVMPILITAVGIASALAFIGVIAATNRK